MKSGRRKVISGVGKGVEVEADDMGFLAADMKFVGGEGGEDPGRTVKIGVLEGGVGISGDGDLLMAGDEAGGAAIGVGEENAVVMERGGGAGAAVDEVVVSWREAAEGEGDEEEGLQE